MVCAKSALEAKCTQEDLVVSRSKLGKGLRFEGQRHTPVHQCLTTTAFRIRTFRLRGGGRPIIQLWAEQFEEGLHETDPSSDFERKVSVFVV